MHLPKVKTAAAVAALFLACCAKEVAPEVQAAITSFFELSPPEGGPPMGPDPYDIKRFRFLEISDGVLIIPSPRQPIEAPWLWHEDGRMYAANSNAQVLYPDLPRRNMDAADVDIPEHLRRVEVFQLGLPLVPITEVGGAALSNMSSAAREAALAWGELVKQADLHEQLGAYVDFDEVGDGVLVQLHGTDWRPTGTVFWYESGQYYTVSEDAQQIAPSLPPLPVMDGAEVMAGYPRGSFQAENEEASATGEAQRESAAGDEG